MYDPLLYLLFFLLYTIMLLWLGRHGFNRAETIRDYYIANGSLGLFTSVSTFGATWFSAASMLGLPSLIYQFGYSVILYSVICWFLGSILIIFLAVKLRDYQVVTVPEFFYKRYQSSSLQVLTGLILVLSYILYIVIQIRGFGIVISYLLDIPYTLAVFLVYLFLIYTTYGGLFSVARTDILNFFLITFGSCVAAYLVLQQAGGWVQVHHDIAQRSTDVMSQDNKWFDPFYYGKSSILVFISSLFSLGLGLACNPQYATRLLSAKSTKIAIRMVGLATLFLSVVYIAMIIIGLSSITLVPDNVGIGFDEIFPFMINEIISSPWKGMILISIVAACISTANSQLLLVASSLIYDVYERVTPKQQKEYLRLRLNKWSITILATISLTLSFNELDGLLFFSGQIWGLIAVTFFFPLFGGLYIKRASKRGAFASIITGIIVYVTWMMFPLVDSTLISPTVPAILLAGLIFYLMRHKHGEVNYGE